jgi:hypothetical protein
MIRLERLLALVAIAAVSATAPASSASAQVAAAEPPPAPAPDRFRLVLNGSLWLAKPSFSDSRTLTEYAEQATIQASYAAGTAFGPDIALQVSLFRGFGILVGYASAKRDLTGQIEVSRPHPLHLNRNRRASADLSGYDLTESAFRFDAAYARAGGHVDWALFAGVTRFRIEADMLQRPTYNDVYPYDELSIASTPSTTVKQSPTGFNVGGRLDYRFGNSRMFGAGVMVRYSRASVKLKVEDAATEATFEAGGLEVGVGLRVYF